MAKKEPPSSVDVLPARRHAKLLDLYAETELPTERGPFRTLVFRERQSGVEHLALVKGSISGNEGVPVRIHSECLTSEVFGSLKCDCRAQLDRALDFIARCFHVVVPADGNSGNV